MRTTEPTSLTAGDTARWVIWLPDYPATAWGLSYELVNAESRIAFAAAPWPQDTTRHLVDVPASTTAMWRAGQYAWRSRVTSGAQVITVGAGDLAVLPSYAAAIDVRSHAERTLAAIEAYLERGDTVAASQYEIAGRSLRRHPIPELLVLRDRYRAEVLRERQARNAGMPTGRVRVVFGGRR